MGVLMDRAYSISNLGFIDFGRRRTEISSLERAILILLAVAHVLVRHERHQIPGFRRTPDPHTSAEFIMDFSLIPV